MNFDILLQAVAEAGIYAILLVLGFALFYKMHKNDIKRMEFMMDKSINAVERSYKNAYDSLNEYIEKHSKEYNKK